MKPARDSVSRLCRSQVSIFKEHLAIGGAADRRLRAMLSILLNRRFVKMKKIIGLSIALMVAASAAIAAPQGNLKVAGSTTVLPLSQSWAEAYMGKNHGAMISVSGGGTGTGISMLLNGTCQIANASRPAKPEEIATAKAHHKNLVATKLAKDGIAIIVNPSNNVKNLTMAQLAGIYDGKITKWSQVGGKSRGKIVVVGRDSSSGTYGYFQEDVLKKGPYCKSMLSMPTNAAVAQAVSQSRDAIGYVGMDYAKPGRVRILSLSKKTGQPGVKPTKSSVTTGKYPLSRYLFAYTNGKPTGLAANFIKFCTSKKGQNMVTKSGYVPL